MTALTGLRVVELVDERTRRAGRLLAELGADVVVVEPPGGSPERDRPPFVGDQPGRERSLRWWADAVGKRSAVLDLETADGRADLAVLLDWADVVLEGEGEGRGLEARGLGWDESSRTRPALIWVSITPFGRQSRRAGVPMSDLTLLAGGGPLWNCGYDDHAIPPVRGAGDQAYNIAALYAAIGALVAVAHRDETGRGQLVDVDINAACNVTSEQTTYNWLLIREVCTRQTGRHAYYVPTSSVQVRCGDGVYATTGVLPREPAEYRRLHDWVCELGLAADLPQVVFLEMAAARQEPVDLAAIGADDETTAMVGAARDAIAAVAASLPAKEFFLQSQRRGFPTGAVLSPDEAFEDEHVVACGFPREVEHPELETTVRYPGVPYVFSASPCPPLRRPPLVGEHTAEVLAEARGLAGGGD